LVLGDHADKLQARLSELPGVQRIFRASPGPGASLI